MAIRQKPVWWPALVPFPLSPVPPSSWQELAQYNTHKKLVANAEAKYNAQQKAKEATEAFGNRPQPMPATVPMPTPIPGVPSPTSPVAPPSAPFVPNVPVAVPVATPTLRPAVPIDDSGLPVMTGTMASVAADASDEEGSRGGGSGALGLLAVATLAAWFLARRR